MSSEAKTIADISPTPLIDHQPDLADYHIFNVENWDEMQTVLASWQADAIQKHARPEQTGKVTEDSAGLSFEEISLYHGSTVPNLTSLNSGEFNSFGDGLYATSEPKKAFAYAFRRSGSKGEEQPTVYEVTLKNVTFYDARNTEQRDKLLIEFAHRITKDYGQKYPEGIRQAAKEGQSILFGMAISLVKAARERDFGEVHRLMAAQGDKFAEFLQEHGYDGIIIPEQEPQTGAHDSFVIFDPTKAEITKSVVLERYETFDHEAYNAAHAEEQQKIDDWFGDDKPKRRWQSLKNQ